MVKASMQSVKSMHRLSTALNASAVVILKRVQELRKDGMCIMLKRTLQWCRYLFTTASGAIKISQLPWPPSCEHAACSPNFWIWLLGLFEDGACALRANRNELKGQMHHEMHPPKAVCFHWLDCLLSCLSVCLIVILPCACGRGKYHPGFLQSHHDT